MGELEARAVQAARLLSFRPALAGGPRVSGRFDQLDLGRRPPLAGSASLRRVETQTVDFFTTLWNLKQRKWVFCSCKGFM